MERHLDSWEESLRRRVTRHEAAPPVHGWEDMERRLAASGLAAPRPVRRRTLWWRAVAAGVAVSAAAAVALVALLAPPASVEDGGLAPAVSRQVAEAAKSAGADAQPVSAPAEHASVSRTLASALSVPVSASSSAETVSPHAASASAASASASLSSSSAESALADAGAETATSQDGSAVVSDGSKGGGDAPAATDAEKRKNLFSPQKSAAANRANFSSSSFSGVTGASRAPRRHAPQFSLAMNAVSAAGTQRQDGLNMSVLRANPSEDGAGGGSGVAGLLSAGVDRNVRTEVDYGMPVQIGLGVSVPLTSRWRINTGLIYTRLSADIRSGSDDVYNVTKQRVYYIGVPVQAGYTFFTSRVADLYVTAGATAEKALKARSEKVYHRADGTVSPAEEEDSPSARGLWQFSANLSAGVQLNVTKWVGVYCEPGVAYYFNDRSELPSVRHEHPWNFNLQAGLRFTLP